MGESRAVFLAFVHVLGAHTHGVNLMECMAFTGLFQLLWS